MEGKGGRLGTKIPCPLPISILVFSGMAFLLIVKEKTYGNLCFTILDLSLRMVLVAFS